MRDIVACYGVEKATVGNAEKLALRKNGVC